VSKHAKRRANKKAKQAVAVVIDQVNEGATQEYQANGNTQ